ncbi:MAG: hypothetical protein AB8B59_15370 [Maribacter sp.]
MKKLTILFLLSAIELVGQNSKKIDSLLNVYQSTDNDSIKLRASNRITSYYMYRDINKAKSFAQIQLQLSKDANDVQGRLKALNHFSTIYSRLSQYDSAQYYIEKTLDLAIETKNLSQESISRHSWVIMEIDRGNYEKAMFLNEKNIKFNQEIQDTLGLAMSYETESSIFTDKGFYELSLKSVMKSLEVYEKLGDSIRIADVFQKIAVIENSLENFDSAIENSNKALKIYERFEDIEYQAMMLNILGISYKFKKQFREAETYFKKSMVISQKFGYTTIYLVSIAHLSDTYLELNENQLAKKLIDEGIATSEGLNSQRMVSYFKMRMAKYLKNVNAKEKSLELLDDIISEFPNEKEYLMSAYKIKMEIYKEQGKFQAAYEHFETFKILEDSTSKKTNAQKINELRIIHQTEQKEAEIALQEEEINTLNEKSRADNLQKGLYAGGMASALALSGLLVFGFRQRMKKNRMAREKQEEIYKQEIAHKKKELASQTLHLVQKNTFLEELKENLEKLKASPDKFKMEFRRIVMLLKKEKASDKDWETFKTYFSEVHNDFDQKLKTLYADISEKEIRLAAFLRMNLTTKEIAATLNVLPDSILKSKYRLKKKLGLDKATDLTSFLNTL